MTPVNRQLRVASWPAGLPAAGNFEIVAAPVPAPGHGEVLIRNLYLSIDPYYRHALGPRFVGTRFRHPGDVMMAVTMGQVVESKDPCVAEGAFVTSLLGDMQDYAVVGGRDVRVLPDEVFGPGRVPRSLALGVAGIPGLTAYAALMVHAKARPGETFVVSSAGGCVGGTAGQIAKIMGLRAVGIAGAPEKIAWAVERAGFDACVSYRSPAFAEQLAAACPNGIDIDLEHVGGEVLRVVLSQMALYGRVIISGMIDQYNQEVSPPGVNWGVFASRRLRACGLRVFDHFGMMAAYERFVGPRILDGSFAYIEDVREGLEAAPAALAAVLTGTNFGKTLVRVG